VGTIKVEAVKRDLVVIMREKQFIFF